MQPSFTPITSAPPGVWCQASVSSIRQECVFEGKTMPTQPSVQDPAQPGVLRVFNSREETRKSDDRIAHIYDLMADHSEMPVR